MSVFKDCCWTTICIANAPKPATCGNSGVLPGGGWIANKRCGYVMGTPDAFNHSAVILTHSRNCCRWSEIRCRIYGQHGLSLWEVSRYRRKFLHVSHSICEHFYKLASGTSLSYITIPLVPRFKLPSNWDSLILLNNDLIRTLWPKALWDWLWLSPSPRRWCYYRAPQSGWLLRILQLFCRKNHPWCSDIMELYWKWYLGLKFCIWRIPRYRSL